MVVAALDHGVQIHRQEHVIRFAGERVDTASVLVSSGHVAVEIQPSRRKQRGRFRKIGVPYRIADLLSVRSFGLRSRTLRLMSSCGDSACSSNPATTAADEDRASAGVEASGSLNTLAFSTESNALRRVSHAAALANGPDGGRVVKVS